MGIVIDGTFEILDITEGATHYHADYVQPAWAKTKPKRLRLKITYFIDGSK